METFELFMPAKADYVLAARLFLSGLASREDFSLDRIEDVKTGFSEACVLMLNKIADGRIKLTVSLNENGMEIGLLLSEARFKAEGAEEEVLEFSRIIIEEIAKDVRFVKEETGIKEIHMSF